MFNASYFFIVLKPNNIEQFFKISTSIRHFVFRGQSDASWGLTTSLERAMQQFRSLPSLLPNREQWMLRQFKRRAHLYDSSLPSDDNFTEWLALMQHYGSPTRFLDFTHSIFTALFFAVESSSQDSAIWAIHSENLFDNMRVRINDNQYNKSIALDRNLFHIQFVNSVVGRNTQDPAVINVEPEHMNERVATQQGLFLVPFNLSLSFQENLSGMFGLSSSVWTSPQEKELPEDMDLLYGTVFKIVIKKSLQSNYIRLLETTNTTAATLFPGLDGFARSLKFHLSM